MKDTVDIHVKLFYLNFIIEFFYAQKIKFSLG